MLLINSFLFDILFFNLNCRKIFLYLYAIGGIEMQTSEVLKKINIPRHKLYYLEQKGYIKPKKMPKGDIEAREYSEEDYQKIEAIWQFLQRGFKHKVAYQKAMEKLNHN